MSDVCACVTKEVRAIVSNYFEMQILLQQHGLLTLIMENGEANLFEREAGVCVRLIREKERTNELTNNCQAHRKNDFEIGRALY